MRLSPRCVVSEDRAPAAPFAYGRRQVISYNQTAQPSYGWLPLAPDDFLAVEPGDEFAEGDRHAADVHVLRRTLRWQHRYSPLLTVLGDLPVHFPGLNAFHPAPDLLIVPDLADRQRPRTHYDVAAEGAHPACIVEVTSPLFAHFDLVEKLALYAQAGVREYVILDAGAPDGQPPVYQWCAYTLRDGVYQPIPAAADGTLHSAVNRVGFGVAADRRGFFVTELRTGKVIVPDPGYEDHPRALEADAATRARALAAQLGRAAGH